MTPQEKASELVGRFINELDSIQNPTIKRIEAKGCAKAAVEEILNTLSDNDKNLIRYWYDVREEIGEI